MIPDSTTSPAVLQVEHGAGTAVRITEADDRIVLDATRDGVAFLERVPLGFELDGSPVHDGAVLDDVSRRSVRESWTAVLGKAAGEHQVAHEELTARFRTPGGSSFEVIVRVAPDGVAFRYRVPEGLLGPEATRYRFPDHSRIWTLEYQTWYETPRFGSALAALPDAEWGFPTLVEAGHDVWVLLSEAGIDGRSSGAHLNSAHGELAVVAADIPLAVDEGHLTPWRVAIAGSPAEIVASSLVDDLAPAADPGIPTVARPGLAAWSWWSSQFSGAYLKDQKRFTDWAAEQGFEHVLVDCGWDPAWVPELVEYAGARSIQVHLWSSWSDLDGPEALRKLGLWASWGVAGIKVDFMESESRDRYRWYDAIIAEAERVGLMVNFHGSVIPRGWARTHPNVVSYEAIRGAEYYVFYGTPLTAAHNVIQPFTRNVVGSMDYTPVTFSAPGRETSDAHELALAVVFESGITHLADDPDQYRARPLANRYLATVPPRWEEIRLVSGHPDREAVIARRNGAVWHVAGISTGDARDLTLDLSGFGESAWLVIDGADGLTERTLDTGLESVTVPLTSHGGFAAVVYSGDAPTGRPARTVRPAPSVFPTRSLVHRGEGALLVTDAGASLRTPEGWTAERTGERTWRIRCPADAPAGSVGVVTIVGDTLDGVPAVTHCTLFVPLDPGTTPLASVPYLWAENSLGPVERGQSNGGGDPNDGTPFTIAAASYDAGFGVTSDSRIQFYLGLQGREFTSLAGIDDATPSGSARVTVLVDGSAVDSARLVAGKPPVQLRAVLHHASVLELRAEPDPSGGDHPAHVDWIDPSVTCGTDAAHPKDTA